MRMSCEVRMQKQLELRVWLREHLLRESVKVKTKSIFRHTSDDTSSPRTSAARMTAPLPPNANEQKNARTVVDWMSNMVVGGSFGEVAATTGSILLKDHFTRVASGERLHACLFSVA
jgi:hypothetical protein